MLIQGKIIVEPDDITNKHRKQSEWKRMSIISFDDDLCDYYSWFIYKKYLLKLNKPIRGSHISLINDSVKDIKFGLGIENDLIITEYWNKFKDECNDKIIDVYLSNEIRSNGKHWWLELLPESEEYFLYLRNGLGLGEPFYGFHLSVGRANEHNSIVSEYCARLLDEE